MVSSDAPSRQSSAAAAALSPAKRAQPAARSSAKRGGVEQESHEVTAIVVLEYKPPAEHTLQDLMGRRCGTHCLGQCRDS